MIDRILVGTNRSSEAESAVRWASALAVATGGEITLVEAFEPQAERTPERGRRLRARAAQELRFWAARLDLSPVLRTRALEGLPDRALPEEAERGGASVVVIGSRPFEGVTSFGFGSLAHRLAHHLHCPLIVVPNRDLAFVGDSLVVGVDVADDDASAIAVGWGEALASTLGAGVHIVRDAPGDLVASVQAAADERPGALIVVSAREHHSFGGLLLGAVPDALLHHPVHPVAVLPHSFQMDAGQVTGTR